RHIVAKKLGETLASDGLCRLLNARGIRKEKVLLGVVVVHPLEQIAQRLPAAGLFTNAEVEEDAENISLVVVADAPLRRPVERVTFEPCVQTRFLRRLPTVGRPALQFG